MTATRWRPFLLAAVLGVLVPWGLEAIGILNDFRAGTATIAVSIITAGLALNMVMGYTGQISLGHFALLGVGAYTSALLTAPDRWALPFFIGVLGAVIVTGAIAFLVGLPALRLRGVYLAVATMAFAFAMEEWLFRSPWISRGTAGVELPRPLFGSFEFISNTHFLMLAFPMLILVWLVDANVTGSKLGRAFQAIRANEDVASSFGVNVTRYKLLAFTISGAFAGVAGTIFGHFNGFVDSRTFAFDRSLLLVIVVVIGGLGSRVGVAISGTFYALFPIIFVEWLGNSWAGIDLIIGAALLLFTISRHPGGLAEALREAREVKEAQRSSPDDEGLIATIPDLPRPTGLPHRERTSGDAPLLAAREITVTFGGLRAVDGVSLDVHAGRIVGLIGPNGAGKTTLFNALSGALKPEAGTVHLLGRDVSDARADERARLGLGRSFQMIGLAPDLSVLENLLLAQHGVAEYGVGSALAGLGAAPRIERALTERALEAIARLGFERYTDTPVKNLSHGQQRIVEIGCVLVTAPDLVMLDEPSAGMAPGAVEHLGARLRDMRDELGRTLLLIEHNIPLVLDVCDELYVMNNGQLLAHGAPEDVVADPKVVGAYLGGAEVVPA